MDFRCYIVSLTYHRQFAKLTIVTITFMMVYVPWTRLNQQTIEFSHLESNWTLSKKGPYCRCTICLFTRAACHHSQQPAISEAPRSNQTIPRVPRPGEKVDKVELDIIWLVVSTPKNISQLGWLFPKWKKYKMFETTNQPVNKLITSYWYYDEL